LLTSLAISEPVPGTAPALAAGCTGNSSYALDTAGALHAWGDNAFGQLGSGSLAPTSGPVVIALPPGTTAWTFVAPGERHCLALASDGALYAWGDNTFGQLGLGTVTPVETRVPAKVPFPAGVTDWRLLASGAFHCLAVSDSGRLYTWGDNHAGQLGLGSTNAVNQPTPVEFPSGVSSWLAIAGGGTHSLAVADTTLLYTWGGNGWGQVGVPPIGANVLMPTRVGSGRWQTVAAGRFFSLALDWLGHLAYWGRTDAFNRIEGPLLTGPSIWTRIVAGGEHYLAIKNDGTLYGGGSNEQGQGGFGDGHGAGVIFPQPIPSYERSMNPFAVAAGLWHSLALATDCTLYAFGTNSHGQLGLPQAARKLSSAVSSVPEDPPAHMDISRKSRIGR
jgi:alpha-tubulin suppressor-like RCC1 family protein